VHLPFNFTLLSAQWHARPIARMIDEYEAALPAGGWPNWVLSNHDRPRIATRIGRERARVAAMLLLTLRGTPTIYYGDEIGMTQVPIEPGRERDPLERNMPGLGLGRDGTRTPMQWAPDAHGAFSRREPWLPLAHDFRTENVLTQSRDQASIFNLHQRLIALRRKVPALTNAVVTMDPAKNGNSTRARAAEGSTHWSRSAWRSPSQTELAPRSTSRR
jgi:alpha-glucosidase